MGRWFQEEVAGDRYIFDSELNPVVLGCPQGVPVLVIVGEQDRAAQRACGAHNADYDALTAERDEIQRRIAQILDRLPEGGVWCYACNRANVPIRCESFYEHIPREYKQMKTTFHCPICKRETYAKDSCVDSLRAIAEGRTA